MVLSTEVRALQDVRDRLIARFPHVGREVVEAAVQVARAGIEGPIRQYVPVLVEHAARERLVAITS